MPAKHVNRVSRVVARAESRQQENWRAIGDSFQGMQNRNPLYAYTQFKVSDDLIVAIPTLSNVLPQALM